MFHDVHAWGDGCLGSHHGRLRAYYQVLGGARAAIWIKGFVLAGLMCSRAWQGDWHSAAAQLMLLKLALNILHSSGRNRHSPCCHGGSQPIRPLWPGNQDKEELAPLLQGRRLIRFFPTPLG